ncbi:hypothetical protein EMPG_15942 [Blastomyces silverae]|uniref:Uncharacterized protein n=1 Tax=Blastomyces silverae TaxID=2060906 RepID=A0A0H1BC59_9EURO|nr:hypothetical protein EMPG_15942 [Blastomyces silverae]
MATLIPISTPSQSTKKGQLEQQSGGGWNSWTPEEQGGVLAASILLFIFFFALALLICLRVSDWDGERRVVDTERGLRERRERREHHRRRRRQRRDGGLSSVAQTMPVPQPRQNRNICTSPVRESGSRRTTRRCSSDERHHRREPDGHGMNRRESTGRSHRRNSREQRETQRPRSCPSARNRVPAERRVGPSGERSHWDRRQPPRESMLVCDGSDETLERKVESDSTDSYADGDPGPSTRKGKEPVRNQHKRHRSEGMARIERPPRHMRSYSVE